MNRAAFALALLCTGLLVCVMAALPVCKEQVLLERETISSGGEMLILIGFLLVPVFNIVSLFWVAVRALQNRAVRKGDLGVFTLGALCLILLIGEKVIVDEISHEYPLGWKVSGEWIILYAFLSIQLIFNLTILRRLYRTSKGSDRKVGV